MDPGCARCRSPVRRRKYGAMLSVALISDIHMIIETLTDFAKSNDGIINSTAYIIASKEDLDQESSIIILIDNVPKTLPHSLLTSALQTSLQKAETFVFIIECKPIQSLGIESSVKDYLDLFKPIWQRISKVDTTHSFEDLPFLYS